MNIDTIQEEFLSAFQAKTVISVRLPPDAPVHYCYSIFPMLCLPQLRDEVRRKANGDLSYSESNEDFLENYGARFIVNLDQQIKFTREGPRTSRIPAHSDIDTRVLTAGNFYFSEDYSKIVKITNKSGHFKPTFASLVFALPLILAAGFPLADEVILENAATQETLTLSIPELNSLIPAAYDLASIIARNNDADVFIDELYQPQLSDPLPFSEPLPSFSIFSMFSSEAGQVRKFDQCSGYESPDENAIKKIKHG